MRPRIDFFRSMHHPRLLYQSLNINHSSSDLFIKTPDGKIIPDSYIRSFDPVSIFEIIMLLPRQKVHRAGDDFYQEKHKRERKWGSDRKRNSNRNSNRERDRKQLQGTEGLMVKQSQCGTLKAGSNS